MKTVLGVKVKVTAELEAKAASKPKAACCIRVEGESLKDAVDLVLLVSC